MNFKNMKHLSFISLVVALMGCNSNVEDKNDLAEASNFYYSPIQVESFETYASDSNWPDLKDRAVVSLNTCIKDTAYKSEIAGQDFTIESDFGSYETDSKSNGCISWTEEFEFDYTAPQGFVEVSGDFIGKDDYRGARSFRIGINPWEKKVVDLGISKQKNIQTLKSLRALSEKARLNISSVQANVVKKEYNQTEGTVKIRLKYTPELILKSFTDGNLPPKTLGSGLIETKVIMVEKKFSTGLRVKVGESAVTKKLDQFGSFDSYIDIDVEKGIAKDSFLEFIIIASAKRDKNDILPFYGVTQSDKLSMKLSSSIYKMDFNLDSIVSSDEKNIETNLGFEINNITVTKGTNTQKANLAKSLDLVVRGLFKVKLIDSLFKNIVEGEKFQVEVVNNQTGNVLFDKTVTSKYASGVLDFTVNFPYGRYDQESWDAYTLRISSQNETYQNITQTHKLYINPITDSSEFAVVYGEPPVIEHHAVPRIKISKVNFEALPNVSENFKLNRELQLKLDKKFRLDFNVFVDSNHNSNNDDAGDKKLINGEYNVEFKVLRPKYTKESIDLTKEININDFETLTEANTTVEVHNGQVEEMYISLPILFAELKLFHHKTVVVMKMTPVEETQLRAGYVVGYMNNVKRSGVVKNTLVSEEELSDNSLAVLESKLNKLKSINVKLKPDALTNSYFVDFLQELESINPEVPVYNHKLHKLEKKEVKLMKFESEYELANVSRVGATAEDFYSTIHLNDYSENFVKTVCDILYDKNTTTLLKEVNLARYSSRAFNEYTKVGIDYKACVSDYKSYFDVKKMFHVQEITKQPNYVHYKSNKLDKSVAYFVSQGEIIQDVKGVRKSNYYGFDFHADFGTHMGGLPFFGSWNVGYSTGYRVDSFTTEQLSKLVSNQKRLINQEGESFSFDKYDVNFDAKVKACFLITPKFVKKAQYKSSRMPYGDQYGDELLQTSNKRIHYCLKDSVETNVSDNWYFIRASVNGVSIDSSMEQNAIVQVLRGKRSFEQFRKLQVDNDKKLVFINTEKSNVVKRFKKHFEETNSKIPVKDRLGVGFPGLIEVN